MEARVLVRDSAGGLTGALAQLRLARHRLMSEAEVLTAIEQEPALMELALAIGDAAWGRFGEHGYEGKVAAADAARAAITVLREHGLPPGAERQRKLPLGRRVVEFLRA